MPEFELLSLYVDAPDMRVNERGAKMAGDCELVRDDKRDSERRVPNPDS